MALFTRSESFGLARLTPCDSEEQMSASAGPDGFQTPLQQCMQPAAHGACGSFALPGPDTPVKRPVKRPLGNNGAVPFGEASPRKRARGSAAAGGRGAGAEEALFLSQESSAFGSAMVTRDELFSAGPGGGGATQPASLFHAAFNEERELGRGSFGSVVLAQHRQDHVRYAVKRSRRAAYTPHDLHTQQREARLLAACASPYVVRYHSTWVDEGKVHIQMEYCRHGSITAALQEGRPWSHVQAAKLVFNIAAALDHLHHTLHVVHLDVKPDNIFQCAPPSAHPSVPAFKLGDFGRAAADPDDLRRRLGSQVAAPGGGGGGCSASQGGLLSQLSLVSLEEGDGRYLPRDMLNDKMFPKEADIFSFGLTIFEVGAARLLSRSDEEDELLHRQGRLPAELLEAKGFGYLHDIVADCVHPSPDCRPCAAQVIERLLGRWRPDLQLPGGLSQEDSEATLCMEALEPPGGAGARSATALAFELMGVLQARSEPACLDMMR